MQIPRKYEMHAISNPATAMSEDQFKQFLFTEIQAAHNKHEYLVCQVHPIETSKQLHPNPPPYSYLVYFTVSKRVDNVSKNFESKSLLYDRLRMNPDLKDFTLTRLYGN